MRRTFLFLSTLALAAAAGSAQSQSPKTLDMYFIDVEGGHSTLYVSPTGETLLIDTGNPGGRDAGRIMEVIQAAGVKKIDHLIITHYHVDHIGGLQEIASKIPIDHFYDHGASIEPNEQVAGFQKMYAELWAKAKHTVAKPGDKIPLGAVTVTVVTSNGDSIKTPLPGGGKPNPACADFKPRDEAQVQAENRMSVGVVIDYGRFRHVNLGDFTYNKEPELMCPNNPIGKVDLYLTSHHGIDQSGSAALVHGLQPRVAIMHNSTGKGGAVPTMQVLHTSPGLEDIWQLHWASAAGLELNTPSLFIANVDDNATMANLLLAPPRTFGMGRGPGGPGAGGPPPNVPAAAQATPTGAPNAPAAAPSAPASAQAAPTGAPNAPIGGPNPPGQGGRGGGAGGGRGGHTGQAYWIKVSAQADGTFSVTNTRNNFTKTYAARN